MQQRQRESDESVQRLMDEVQHLKEKYETAVVSREDALAAAQEASKAARSAVEAERQSKSLEAEVAEMSMALKSSTAEQAMLSARCKRIEDEKDACAEAARKLLIQCKELGARFDEATARAEAAQRKGRQLSEESEELAAQVKSLRAKLEEMRCEKDGVVNQLALARVAARKGAEEVMEPLSDRRSGAMPFDGAKNAENDTSLRPSTAGIDETMDYMKSRYTDVANRLQHTLQHGELGSDPATAILRNALLRLCDAMAKSHVEIGRVTAFWKSLHPRIMAWAQLQLVLYNKLTSALFNNTLDRRYLLESTTAKKSAITVMDTPLLDACSGLMEELHAAASSIFIREHHHDAHENLQCHRGAAETPPPQSSEIGETQRTGLVKTPVQTFNPSEKRHLLGGVSQAAPSPRRAPPPLPQTQLSPPQWIASISEAQQHTPSRKRTSNPSTPAWQRLDASRFVVSSSPQQRWSTHDSFVAAQAELKAAEQGSGQRGAQRQARWR